MLTRVPRIGCVAWQNSKTEDKQGKYFEFISLAKAYKSQNINPISPAPKFNLDITIMQT